MVKPYVTRDNLEQKTAEWLKSLESINPKRWGLRPSRAALLVVDMQNYFLDPKADHFSVGGEAIVPNVTRLIDSFRRAGRPVLFTKHEHSPDDLDQDVMQSWWGEVILAGTPEAELADQFNPRDDEPVIRKRRYSAFFETDLERILNERGIADLVIAGIKTNLCCESTARDAYYRNYRVFVPADGTGTGTEEMHLASLLNLAYGFASVVTTHEIVEQISN